jgi:hypothetical protein
MPPAERLTGALVSALGEPFRPGSPGGVMKCPTCGENTPDAWRQLIVELSVPDAPATPTIVRLTLGMAAAYELEAPGHPYPHRIHFDRMSCAAKGCGQLVVRGHDTYTIHEQGGLPTSTTDTWIIHPRHHSRPLDPLVPEASPALAGDYAEAVAVLDMSHRMSAVLARSILADLLEAYAKLDDFRLVDRVDKFIENTAHPYDVRDQLHYLREIADLSAHTKKDQSSDQLQRIEITREEADWTLSIVERLFDYFIVSPGKADRLKKGIDEKLEKAGRKKIDPLPPDPPVS